MDNDVWCYIVGFYEQEGNSLNVSMCDLLLKENVAPPFFLSRYLVCWVAFKKHTRLNPALSGVCHC